MSTLTYAYAEQTAVLGPLSPYPDPHSYDLCPAHSERLTAPRGWAVVRVEGEPSAQAPTSDDISALADAVREAGRATHEPVPTSEVGRRGHLRALPTPS